MYSDEETSKTDDVDDSGPHVGVQMTRKGSQKEVQKHVKVHMYVYIYICIFSNCKSNIVCIHACVSLYVTYRYVCT